MRNVSLLILSFVLFSCSSEENDSATPIENPYYDQAFDYLDSGQPDSAFLAFAKAKDIFARVGDSLNTANSLIQMAVTLTQAGDYFGAQETSLQAVDYLNDEKPDHREYISANANNLGNASYQLQDLDRALDFYRQAMQFADDSATKRIYLNNQARTLQRGRRYEEALGIYESIAEANGDNPLEYARSLTNLANTRWLKDSDYNPVPTLLKALHIRQEKGDLLGQNSSYAHLAAYYEGRLPDSALYYARKRYDIAQRLKNAEDRVLATYRLAKLVPATEAKAYFERYKQLTDSIQLARSTAANQFALIRYEAEKSKAENLRLENENTVQAFALARQRVLTFGAIFSALLAVLALVYWNRKRKQRLELETQNRIKNLQLQTSRKIHDVVANGIYRVMAEVENRVEIDREELLDRLEDMYEKSRDISYETDGADTPQMPFHTQVGNLLRSFATDTTKVIIVGNEPELWESVERRITVEVKHILQELMVNMRKHSGASQVVVRFEMDDQQIVIHYKDNGRGMPQPFVRRKGLSNTGNRIDSIGGHLTFENEMGGGLRIVLSVPVAPTG